MIFLKFKNKKILGLIKINFIIIFLISFFPIGKYGIKYLEKDYFEQLPLKNIDNIIVLAGAEDLAATLKTNKLNLSESSERLIASISLFCWRKWIFCN